MKLQQTSDPDNIGPVESNIYIHRVIKIIKFSILYFTFSSCFYIWWKNILCSVTKCLCFKKMRGTTPRQIRYARYCEWALKIMKFQQEDCLKHYNYLEEVLNYICALVPNDIQGEILEDSYTTFGWKNSVKPCKLSYCSI